jgi:YVTN family beta-propeller protein
MKHAETQNALIVTNMTGKMSWWGRVLIFQPDSLFGANDTVRITVTTAAQNTAGTALESSFNSSFTCGSTADSIRPTVIFTSPDSGQTGVDAQVAVSAVFSEKLGPWAAGSFSLEGVTVISGNTTLLSDSILKFTPAAILCSDMTFTATIDSTVTDLCGNRLSPQYSWTFKTIADTTKPKVLSVDPANGDTLVSINKSIVITFSEIMDTATARAAFSINPSVAGNFTWSGGTIMTFTLADTLSFSRQYQITIGTGAQDLSGNALASAWNSSFTTDRGLYVCCNTSNEIYIFQQSDMKSEGYLPYYTSAKQVKFSPSGNKAYVLCDGNPGQLYFLDVKNGNNNLGSISVGNTPYALAVPSDSSKIAVSVSGDNRVLIINPNSMKITDTIAAGNTPTGIAFSSDGLYIYVLCAYSSQIERYLLSNHTRDYIDIVNGGDEVALTPSGSRLFATNGYVVTVIRTSDFTKQFTISSVSNHPFGLAVSPDGAHLAVSCYQEGVVKVYDANASVEPSVLAQVTVGTGPKGLAYSPDGKYLYVSNSGSSSITPISRSGNTYTNQSAKTVGSGPWGIAVTP